MHHLAVLGHGASGDRHALGLEHLAELLIAQRLLRVRRGIGEPLSEHVLSRAGTPMQLRPGRTRFIRLAINDGIP